jgi:hypothetical protein
MELSRLVFRVLIIDDDLEMNKHLVEIIKGLITSDFEITVIPKVDYLDIELDPQPGISSFWQISKRTLEQLDTFSQFEPYDLIISDYGFITDEGKAILWPEGRVAKPTIEDAKGRILTLADLRIQYEDWLRSNSRKLLKQNIFDSTKRMILRSFASNKAYDILGPVKEKRYPITQGVFPNAFIDIMDTRQEFFGANDQFYSIYDNENYGRNFYRHLVCTYTARIVRREIYRFIAEILSRIRLKRSVFNIALFAGTVASIGLGAQLLADLGLKQIANGNNSGWLFIINGFLVITIGALLIAARFEKFSRSIIRWFSSDDNF